MRKSYPTDLSDNEWRLIRSFFKKRPRRGGRPYTLSKREIVNAIFYILRSGCAWRLLPHDFPNWHTVYNHFRDGENQGIWEKINAKLMKKWRIAVGKEQKPTGALIDSQSVRTTEKGGLAEDMMEPKRLKEGKGMSSLIPRGSYYRLKLALGTSATKKG
ncbi:MAG: transposase [Ignavibacteriae bacterium]|nr:transposase [Ignavibacteriota bacterium]